MDPIQRRQAQARSHSISEHGYHLNGQFHRLKHPVYNNNQRLLDNYQNYATQYGGHRSHQIPIHYQHQVQRHSPSPLDSQIHFGSSYREAPIGFHTDHLVRNQMHTSLECLNLTQSDYPHPELKKLQDRRQQQQQFQQQPQQQTRQHNQHYASSYVLMAPPVNTIINQNGDQDLAAAAMDNPPSQYRMTAMPISSETASNRSLINRTLNQVPSSPYRRLNNASGISSNVLNNLSHPIRAGHSSLSLASSSFILEDKLQNEIRKLQSELRSEVEKNDALNSQLNINSSLMAAFEQSLTTLNTRLRQLTTLNEKKDSEIDELRGEINLMKMETPGEKRGTTFGDLKNTGIDKDWSPSCDFDEADKSELFNTIRELKRQLLEKDRLLTDTRLEALSAAHQLEQLESKMNGEHGLIANEDDLDEGVMVVNHSPSDSEGVTDSVNFSEINSRGTKNNEDKYKENSELASINMKDTSNKFDETSRADDQNSNHSSDLHSEVKEEIHSICTTSHQQFNDSDSGVMCKLLDNLVVSN